ncbi:DUF1631 domain-containing protein [Pseudoxanthomonas daejeonensis]|uniref:Thymidine phosphorylase n=1 Tax=Pseudoxanthomonas daejeonensis TaxID=266062 RepID=A0ABQ6Z829_9GAMM|nr:DUF1631 domain-containing protein [Pseudoxanthomonas daejeonensis]KAF1695346.1 thymidine phosphorylase [Pseudoxanthomonas daejeonensis]
MSSTVRPTSIIGAASRTLANAALPPRVRHILEAINALAGQTLTTSLNLALNEFERQLFKQADRARSSQQQSEHFAELQRLRQHRADVVPRYLAGLETSLARLRETPEHDPAEEPPPQDPLQFQRLTLVEDTDLDRDIVLREIGRREAQRGGTPLLLLGQRFAVLAGRPAFDPERLPIGPFALCRVLRDAGDTLHMTLDSQLLLYRVFERQVMERYGELVERLNVLLTHEGVLPGLVYLPYRPRTQGQSRGRGAASGSAGAVSQRPLTGWHGQARPSAWSGALMAGLASRQPHPGAETGEGEAAPAEAAQASAGEIPEQAVFAALQGMLTEHRGGLSGNAGLAGAAGQMPGVILPLDAVVNVLGAMQAIPSPARTSGRPRRTVDDLRQAMLARMRESHGPEAGLSQEHSDTFELLGMLYHEIGREVHEDAPAQDLLEKLQVPVVRAAVQDRSFFVRDQHPARELLNSVAESGATWLADDDADPQLVLRLEQAVDKVVEEYAGDESVFERANREVQEHYRAQAHKAEVSERRQVEAARGRDRLETAKHSAATTIAARLGGRKPPQFVQALINQAWADVLTLTALRHGEESEEWREREEATGRIIDITCAAEAPADPELAGQIDSALRQVGYHEDEASAIARRLSRSDEDENTSRTELTAKLKARARLGEGEHAEAKKVKPPARTTEEQGCYEHLRTLPFGTWFEFVHNQQGDVRRQRLSWYSPVTDNALFVNARGHKVGEQSLDSLARLMAQGQARIVTEDKGRLIDRAWHATLRVLRGLAGRSDDGALGAASA